MIHKKYLYPALISFALISAGCGGDADRANGTAGRAADNAGAAEEPAGSASVSGTIRFTGDAPERQRLNVDRECQELRDDPALSESVVTSDDGALRWVFVYVKEGLGDRQFAAPSEPVILDQEGCMYDPHVFGVQTGQTIKILNSDPLLHNIHALPEKNRPFNFGMPTKGQERDQSFRTPEIMVRIKCDVHPWMQAWAGVTEHPYYSVSGEDGEFSIDDLPAGEYTIEAWHEEYGTQTQTVTLEDGESATLDFTFGQQMAAS